jgi:hypothetical protein
VSFVRNLSELVHTFKKPIQEKKLLSVEEIEKVFMGVEEIYEFHKILLENLTARTKNWTSGKPIGDIFVKLVIYFST